MAVTNHISVNHVMSDSDLAKQYQAELKRLRHSLSKRSSGVEESAAVYTLKQQVCCQQQLHTRLQSFALPEQMANRTLPKNMLKA